MDISRKIFRKLILLYIVVLSLIVAVEFLQLFTDYELLEQKLHQGYFYENDLFLVIIPLISVLTLLISIFLLFTFKNLGRPIYLVWLVLTNVYLAFSADFIQYSLLYPVDSFAVFLEVFILYLIYLTPLKNEFR